MIAPLAILALVFPLQDAIPPGVAQDAFGEYEEAALADGGELWGCELLGPMLFADARTRTVVANQPDEQGKLAEREGVFVGTLPLEVGIANTALDWAGVRWTMVMWPLPSERFARVTLLLHEAFHRVQPSLPHAGGSELAPHLDQEAGRVWLRLEMRALARALRTREEAQKTAIGEALLFRARRQALFPPARALEASVERNEGLAEYTGFALCGASPEVRAERAAQKLLGDERGPSFVRSFAYATGPGYGILLDQHAAGWRARIGKESELATMLAAALDWKAPEELAGAAEEALANYDGAKVRAEERARAEQQAARAAELRARFVDGPVLVLPLGTGVNYTFDPTDIATFDGLGSFYGSISITESWGVLEAGGGALVERDARGAMTAVRVALAEKSVAAPLAGPGWKLTLASGKTLAAGARAGDWTVAR
jgi:hypothetical protein